MAENSAYQPSYTTKTYIFNCFRQIHVMKINSNCMKQKSSKNMDAINVEGGDKNNFLKQGFIKNIYRDTFRSFNLM